MALVDNGDDDALPIPTVDTKKQPNVVIVRLMSGELLAELPGRYGKAKELIDAVISKSPPTPGTTYQLFNGSQALPEDLPTDLPSVLELSAVVVKFWSGRFHKQTHVGDVTGREWHYSTGFSFRSNGFALFEASEYNKLSGSKMEASGYWESTDIGSLSVTLSRIRRSNMHRGSYGDWSEPDALQQKMEFTKEARADGGDALTLLTTTVNNGREFVSKHARAGTVFNQVTEDMDIP